MDKHLQDILDSIDELANRGGITRSRAFAAWYSINFFDLDEDDALEAAAADGGNDQGIDIAFADDSSQELVILQAHCPENFEKKTPVAKWHAVSASLPYLLPVRKYPSFEVKKQRATNCPMFKLLPLPKVSTPNLTPYSL
jgi:hypothetical protein